MTTLEDLWYGNINPNETILIQNRQFKHLLSLMGKSRDKLTDTFANQQKDCSRNMTMQPMRCTPSQSSPPSNMASPSAFDW